jgi:hypothetical protein
VRIASALFSDYLHGRRPTPRWILKNAIDCAIGVVLGDDTHENVRHELLREVRAALAQVAGGEDEFEWLASRIRWHARLAGD